MATLRTACEVAVGLKDCIPQSYPGFILRPLSSHKFSDRFINA